MCCFYNLITVRNYVFIILSVFLQLIYNGYAIKCFVCDSTDNPSCANLKSNASLHAEECTLENMKSMDTWLFELNKLAFHKNTPYSNPLFNCQKVVAHDPRKNMEVTARFCQLDTADSKACEILGKKMVKNEMHNNPFNMNNRDGVGRHNNFGAIDGTENIGSGDKQNKNPYIHCSICSEDSCNASPQLLSRKRSLFFLLTLPPLLLWLQHLACW